MGGFPLSTIRDWPVRREIPHVSEITGMTIAAGQECLERLQKRCCQVSSW